MQLTITRPDDWHLHLRDGEALASVLAHTARQFGRAIVMPNLKPPVTTVEQAAAYRERIIAALPAGAVFEPLMTLYLTDNTPASEVVKAAASGFVKAIKLYPAGATTNSDAGLTAIEKAYDTLAEMERVGLPLLVHGEATDPKIDLFDREKVFIDTVLLPLTQRFPQLKVVMEHITTQDAAEFVANSPLTVAATITAHHLLYNRNAIFLGGVRPHWYCLPVLKRETHRAALLAAATSGNPNSFSAPIRRRMPRAPRKPPAVAPAATPPTPHLNFMRKPSTKWGRSTSLKPSPVSMARTGTACRAIAAR
jgi:dihydroorotase